MGADCGYPCTHGKQVPMDSGVCNCDPCYVGKHFHSGSTTYQHGLNPYIFPHTLYVLSTIGKISLFYKVLAVLRNVQVMENAKMELAFVMNLVDGEVLCVRCQDAQG
jgi:hypothetical protein